MDRFLGLDLTSSRKKPGATLYSRGQAEALGDPGEGQIIVPQPGLEEPPRPSP